MPEYLEAKRRVDDIHCAMGVRIDSPFFVFNLMATNPARNWWEPYYPELIAAVQEMGIFSVGIGTKESPGDLVVNLVGKTSTVPEYYTET
jgi:hypothetical protein